jgi:phosphoribosylformimino-5-aminoimidazole carboxamide ribotide isomerase
MRILPAIDIKGGCVVRGIGGERAQYRPIVSPFCPGSDALEVALAFRRHFGLNELYVADLDAISGLPQRNPFASLVQAGFSLWLDAGTADARCALELAEAGIHTVIIGLETLPGSDVLAGMVKEVGTDRLVFSLDLKEGMPIGDLTSWPSAEPHLMTRGVVEAGVRRLLVLDLAHVGRDKGVGTLDLCRSLARTFPDIELAAGGGVRGLGDLLELERAGVDIALVASALHDGRLTPEQIARFR